jgi:hypothetical protein
MNSDNPRRISGRPVSRRSRPRPVSKANLSPLRKCLVAPSVPRRVTCGAGTYDIDNFQPRVSYSSDKFPVPRGQGMKMAVTSARTCDPLVRGPSFAPLCTTLHHFAVILKGPWPSVAKTGGQIAPLLHILIGLSRWPGQRSAPGNLSISQPRWHCTSLTPSGSLPGFILDPGFPRPTRTGQARARRLLKTVPVQFLRSPAPAPDSVQIIRRQSFIIVRVSKPCRSIFGSGLVLVWFSMQRSCDERTEAGQSERLVRLARVQNKHIAKHPDSD